jgi:hypothetical protein
MIDIKDKLLDVARGDTALRGLLGGTVTDPRIYPYYEGKAEISAVKPAYITYSQSANPEPAFAIESPVFTWAIWGRTWTQVEAVRDRLRTLFQQQIYVTVSPYSRRLYTKVINETDSFQQQPDFAGKTVHIRAGWLTV